MNDRAATETLGFVFAFALVTATVGVVYTTGIEGLDDSREFEQVNNAQRAFDVLADNLEDVHREGAPSRATELRLGGATIGYRQPITVRLRVNDTDTAANESFVMHPRPLAYSGVGDSEIVYVGGAVFRTSGDASVMVHEPGYLFGSRRTVVPFLRTYPRDDAQTISGDSTVLVIAHRSSTGLAGQFTDTTGGNATVNVTVESPRADGWRRYFEQQGLTVTESSATAVTAEFETARLYVPEAVVELELTR